MTLVTPEPEQPVYITDQLAGIDTRLRPEREQDLRHFSDGRLREVLAELDVERADLDKAYQANLELQRKLALARERGDALANFLSLHSQHSGMVPYAADKALAAWRELWQ